MYGNKVGMEETQESHACRKRNETRTKRFLEKQFGFRDETGIKSTETRWATVGFMRHTSTLNISYLNKYCIICIYNTYLGRIYSVCMCDA